MLVAEDRLVFVEHNPVFSGASDMVVVGAPVLETLDSRPWLLANFADQIDAVLEGGLDVDQSSWNSFVDFLAPESAVQMNPLVHVVVQKSPATVGRSVALHAAEQAFPESNKTRKLAQQNFNFQLCKKI